MPVILILSLQSLLDAAKKFYNDNSDSPMFFVIGVPAAIIALLVLFSLLMLAGRMAKRLLAGLLSGFSGSLKLAMAGSMAERALKGQKYREAGDLFLRAGDKRRAADAYARGGDFARAGRLLTQEKLFDAAADMFSRAGHHQQAGETYRQAGKFALAATEYEKARKRLLAAEMHQQAGNFAKAGEIYEQAFFREKAAAMYERAGDSEKVIHLLRADLEIKALSQAKAGKGPSPEDLRNKARKLAKAYLNTDQPEKAVETLESVGLEEEGQEIARTLSPTAITRLHSLKEQKKKAEEAAAAAKAEARKEAGPVWAKSPQAAPPQAAPEPIAAVSAPPPGTREPGTVRLPPDQEPQATIQLPAEAAAEVAALSAAPPPPAAPPTETSELPSLPRSGDTIFGCRIEKLIGRGGLGAVYKAKHLRLETAYALKILTPVGQDFMTNVERFIHEAKIAARLNHPGIVRVLDVDEWNGLHGIRMEYVEGTSLAEKVEKEGALSIRETLRLGKMITEALLYAHQNGVVHRDVKPENILLTPDNNVKLTDFGLAKSFALDPHLTISGTIVGSPLFMPPEQARGNPTDGRSDIYALGATLYFLVAGEPPFTGNDPINIIAKHLQDEPVPVEEKRPDVPPLLAGVIMKMLRKKPEERPQTMAEILSVLDLVKV